MQRVGDLLDDRVLVAGKAGEAVDDAVQRSGFKEPDRQVKGSIEGFAIEDSTGVQGACVLDSFAEHETDSVHHRQEVIDSEVRRQTFHGLGD